MACQSQKGIYWLDLADTILVDFGRYTVLSSYGWLAYCLFLDGDGFSRHSVWLDTQLIIIFSSRT